MGFFSNVFNTGGGDTTLSANEAFMGTLLAVIAVDGHIADEEVGEFKNLLGKAKMLRSMTDGEYKSAIDKILRIVRKEGSFKLFELCAQFLPQDKRQGVFAMACDMLFADGVVENEEEKLLELMKAKFAISDDFARKVAEVSVAKASV